MRFLISTIRVFFILTIISIGKIGHTESFFRIPVVDLDYRHDLQIVVDKEEGVYLGHPSTVLLEDGKTILIVYPKGHGKGEIVYKRSRDAQDKHLPLYPQQSEDHDGSQDQQLGSGKNSQYVQFSQY
jgi:hypothetical protein